MSNRQMIVNYVPGEECRVAVVEDGKLEELHAERMNAVSRVGNIYVGRVTNVEAGIQAAFVDFGVGESGFLHVTDLHPRYFPNADDDTAERVGKKTPRRARPPIQACLRRGDEVLVQVLKEGVGTKGPALTSYLSIPGRYLVMMPQMDHVGVSRKVEDDEARAQMRQILDQLELPEGFGFIVRTAGMDRTKTELKRDLAYLQRLWKDMERRLKSGNRPRLLYSESDLLVRALRDILTADVNEIIIDSELALKRASRFLKIVSPRSATRLLHYPGRAPIFHAFGVERQIALIHAREVPLPSGGRLVIDETEALVAIDVNSGKMRDARDAETTAYRTNLEAVEEICRQIRLRDVGGLIINDLIDMRDAKHRRDIEHQFKERLKLDRARTTTLPISSFGILEMTRQRMRGSHESIHFTQCPTCRGRGLVQKPDSICAEALRDLAAILDRSAVAKVEMVVSPRVAGELLSARRRALNRIERTSGKHVDVRVSEAVPIDRVTFYAYDQGGADIDLSSPAPAPARPEIVEWHDPDAPDDWAAGLEEEQAATAAAEAQADQVEEEVVTDIAPHPIELDGMPTDDAHAPAPDSPTGGRRKRRRRRGRGGRSRDAEAPGLPHAGDAHPAPDAAPRPEPQHPEPAGVGAPEGTDGAAPPGTPGAGEGGGRRRRRRRRRRGGRGQGSPDGAPAPMHDAAHAGQHPPRPQGGEVFEPGGEPADAARSEPSSWDVLPGEPVPAPGPAGAANPPRPDGQQGEEQRGGRRRRRRRRRGGGHGGGGATPGMHGSAEPPPRADQAHEPKPQPTGGWTPPPAHHAPQPPARPVPPPRPEPPPPIAGAKPPPRPLYGFRRKLSASDRTRPSGDRE